MTEQKDRNRCLYIIGPQSTGKTTLVNALEDFYREQTVGPVKEKYVLPTIIREVARTVFKEKAYVREELKSSPARAIEIQKDILAAQLKVERSVGCHMSPGRWYISDRSGLDPIVYTHMIVGEEATVDMLNTETWNELKEFMMAGVVLLCEAGGRWLEDDGMRMMPESLEEWMKIDETFRKLLDSEGIPYVVVLKDMESIAERVKFVREQIRKKD